MGKEIQRNNDLLWLKSETKGSINKNQVNINHSCGHHHDYNLSLDFGPLFLMIPARAPWINGRFRDRFIGSTNHTRPMWKRAMVQGIYSQFPWPNIWYSTFILGSWNFHWNIPHASQWHVTNHHGGPVQCDLEVGDGLIMNSKSIPSCLPNLAADSKAWVINQFLAKSLVGLKLVPHYC